MHAYRDGESCHYPCPSIPTCSVTYPELFLVDTLDHFEVPFIGRLANSFVDNE